MGVGTYADFFTALGKNESGNNYGFVSSLGYLGRFQFGEEALQAIGFYNGDGSWAIDFAGGWTGKAQALGVYDKQSFLNSGAAQDAAAHDWFARIAADLDQLGLRQYEGQWIGGVQITTSGLVAGAHLVGVWNLKSFLQSGGAVDTRDGYGTPVSEYVSKFGGFDTPFSGGAAPQPAAPVIGGAADDLLHGTSGGDNLEGGAGADTIFGGEGDDRLVSGDGRSQLRGEGGNDVLLGGAEFDDLHGNQGADSLYGGFGNDWVVGGQGGDLLYGDDGADLVYGNMGADSLVGGAGDDRLLGGQDNDTLDGGAGADFLSGDRGDDVIYGGAGADRFFTFDGAATDRVMDFNYAEGDRVSVAPGSAYTVYQGDAGVVVDLYGGDQMVLVGVNLANLPTDWIA